MSTRKLAESLPFARAVRVWPVKSAAVRNELAKHSICPDCGSDVPERARNAKGAALFCRECGWKETKVET